MSAYVYTPSKVFPCQKEELRSRIEHIISTFGIPKAYTGVKYLKRAIELVYWNPDAIHNVISGLYRTIATEYNTTIYCVERDCRTVIHCMWKVCAPRILCEFFPETETGAWEKPTVRKFIAVITERLRCSLMGEQIAKYAEYEIL